MAVVELDALFVLRRSSAAFFEIRSQIIRAKQHFALSRGHYHWQHELCWYAVWKEKPASWCGDREQSTLWEVSNPNPFGGEKEPDRITGHGTQMPVELMRRPLLNHTDPTDESVLKILFLNIRNFTHRWTKRQRAWI